MRNKTITTIVVFIFILTNILCLYEAMASCGVNDDEERNEKIIDAKIEVMKREIIEQERFRDYDEAREEREEFESNSNFFDEILTPIVTEGWWKLLGGGVLLGPPGIIVGASWEFLKQMKEAFDTLDELTNAQNEALEEWRKAKVALDFAKEDLNELKNHNAGANNDGGCNDGGCNDGAYALNDARLDWTFAVLEREIAEVPA